MKAGVRMGLKKFATQIDEEVLVELKKYAAEVDKSISGVITEAVREFLSKKRTRPAFQSEMKEVIEENKDLLSSLTK